MDIYTHVTDEAKEKTAEMFQKYMHGILAAFSNTILMLVISLEHFFK
ncbi:hypothetical protein [Bacillus massilinigeriensis]|nr:hypothetical protein [Bacillus mediterraneensis]